MNANELADAIDKYLDSILEEAIHPIEEVLDQSITMLRQQQAEIESLKAEGRVLMQHIADINEDKKKLRLQKSYIVELEQALESSINLNKAQAERHNRNE